MYHPLRTTKILIYSRNFPKYILYLKYYDASGQIGSTNNFILHTLISIQ